MGQWNTLHLFDEDIFYDKVVPSFKEDPSFLKKYFNNDLEPFILEDSQVLMERNSYPIVLLTFKIKQ